MFKRLSMALVLLVLFSAVSFGQVLIGVNNINGASNHGWRLYDFGGTYIEGSEVAAYSSTVRYLAGWAIKHGEGMDEVTLRRTRDDLSNQYHYLTTYDVASGAIISSITTNKNGFGMSSTRIGFGGTFVEDANSVANPNVFNPVYAYAICKKEAYSHFQWAYGAIMDGDLTDTNGIDFTYYESTSAVRHLPSLAYDPDSGLGYGSSMRWDEGTRDDVYAYEVDKDAWTVIDYTPVPTAWGNKCHIMDMSMGPDYNDDGDYDVYVAVVNDANDYEGGFNDGLNFWTVLDIDLSEDINNPGNFVVSCEQIAPEFTVVPEAGDIYGIALDMYQEVVWDCATMIGAGKGIDADLSGDCRVNLNDYALFSGDLSALAVFCSEWLDCLETSDTGTGCP